MVLIKELAAGVGHNANGLGEQKRTLGIGEVDTPARLLGGNALVVANRVEAKEREVESVLPTGRAMARAVVAAGLGKNRQHVQAEADRAVLGRVLNRDKNDGALASMLNDQLGLTVRTRAEHPVRHAGNRGIGNRERRFACEVLGHAIGLTDAHDDGLLVLARA